MANLATVLIAVAVTGALLYICYQLNDARNHRRATALLQRIEIRINTWIHELDIDALRSAKDKFFEDELYKRDQNFHEIDELNQRERQALIRQLEIDLVYFQLLYYQRKYEITGPEESGPLDYVMALNTAPHRRHWKDRLRLINHFPADFVRHIDGIVKKFDEVERVMDADQDADFEAVFLEVFNVPAPPDWLQPR